MIDLQGICVFIESTLSKSQDSVIVIVYGIFVLKVVA